MDFDIDISSLPTPSYIVDERLLIKNLEKLKSIIDRTGCRILLAQKGFSMFYFYPLIKKYLNFFYFVSFIYTLPLVNYIPIYITD